MRSRTYNNPVGGEFFLRCKKCRHRWGPLVRWPAKCPRCGASKEKMEKVK